MELSDKAIQDLKTEIQKKYGTNFDLDNKDLNEIGLFLLIALMEGLKLK